MIKIGLLPLYLKLYDDSSPNLRQRHSNFYALVAKEFEKKGVRVVEAPICRVAEEFQNSVDMFEKEEADAIVTLHLAYSPSLESSEALSGTDLPIVILDTTQTYDFGPEQKRMEITYNHGIHGVQDMCNLLIRNKKSFSIEAGHWDNSDVMDRVVSRLRSIKMAANMKKSRIGLIGSPFKGMGDFQVAENVLQAKIGVETVKCGFDELFPYVKSVTGAEIESEIRKDREKFNIVNIGEDAYAKSVRTGIAVRKWIAEENLTGFTMNFTEFTSASGMPTVPFLEACKSMERGIGYAGEGDVLTASLAGAILPVNRDTTFTEIFCPDWKSDSLFLSHMGEMNLRVCAEKPTAYVMDFNYTDIDKPVTVSGRFRPGRAVFVNLTPGPDNAFSLILASVEVLDIHGNDNMEGSIHGWIRPEMPISFFLERFSASGGTHHSVMVYDASLKELKYFGEIMNWNVIVI